MPLKLYMDVHTPAAITDGLRSRSVDVLTSQEDGTREADDDKLLERATELGRLLFAQDYDLIRIATDWQRRGRHFTGLVFAHQENTSIGGCIEDIELLAQCCGAAEVANRVIYLPLA